MPFVVTSCTSMNYGREPPRPGDEPDQHDELRHAAEGRGHVVVGTPLGPEQALSARSRGRK
jgi:hypothetical protein